MQVNAAVQAFALNQQQGQFGSVGCQLVLRDRAQVVAANLEAILLQRQGLAVVRDGVLQAAFTLSQHVFCIQGVFHLGHGLQHHAAVVGDGLFLLLRAQGDIALQCAAGVQRRKGVHAHAAGVAAACCASVQAVAAAGGGLPRMGAA